jgi:hypothetical protein
MIATNKEIMKNREIDPKQYEPRQIKNVISRSKGDFIDVDNFSLNEKSGFENLVSLIWRDYEKKYHQRGKRSRPGADVPGLLRDQSGRREKHRGEKRP